MKMYALLYSLVLLIMITLTACEQSIEVTHTLSINPSIVPDYVGVTIPPNIAPLNFSLNDSGVEARLRITFNTEILEVTARKNRHFDIPASRWSKLLQQAQGDSLTLTLLTKIEGEWVGYPSFPIYVSEDKVDSYLVYRLIEPGYVLWNQMGIYQRNLESFEEHPIVENKMSSYNCMNCHAFCQQNPDKMLFHMREGHPCTILIDGNRVEKLNTNTPETIGPLVYPSWHPGGRFVAFSTNKTQQAFHINHANRVEVFDLASDVVVYDSQKREIITTHLLSAEGQFETFPSFSADGKRLFFCSTVARPMPEEYEQVQYSLCSIAFDPETRSFGMEVDTLYYAEREGGSVSFPRASPDGTHLVYTLSDYGNFSIWHQESDLYLLTLPTGNYRALSGLNSSYAESYHSWSSNSRWIVFSSRREDGLYTRPYLSHIDADGKEAKPFLLPQAEEGFYFRNLKSYNIPEFITKKVSQSSRTLSHKAKTDEGMNVRFVHE